jgi:sugar/nucleoside kinase (ribokinase family)
MEDSANARVTPDFVAAAASDFAAWQGQAIALAAPEVSLESRQALLQWATEHGFYRVLAINSGEARLPSVAAIFNGVDLLALNLDEAAAFTGLTGPLPAEAIAGQAARRLGAINAGLSAVITAGVQGSWAWDGASLRHYPALPAQVEGTAGAGDAFLAGMIVGRVAGLSPFEAQELATLVAALSVTSPHTIHPAIDRLSLREFALLTGARLSESTQKLLEGAS